MVCDVLVLLCLFVFFSLLLLTFSFPFIAPSLPFTAPSLFTFTPSLPLCFNTASISSLMWYSLKSFSPSTFPLASTNGMDVLHGFPLASTIGFPVASSSGFAFTPPSRLISSSNRRRRSFTCFRNATPQRNAHHPPFSFDEPVCSIVSPSNRPPSIAVAARLLCGHRISLNSKPFASCTLSSD